MAKSMKATEAPTMCHPDWNRFRSRVIAAVTDVEAQMQQLGKSLNYEGLTCEVALRLGLAIDTPDDFAVLEKLVRAVRPIAQDALRCTREEQGGQFALLLL
ncbi:hypothetical protein F1C16_21100 (plasmid) [Hymenobacter sp. NBH84]|uniref:hypothetical protein n=1 Tax=Hymenobacter sp. NBH84 TaxID=2596915 RepID=UPI00162AF7C6|nr:hypothetical protein [Hymenobacter sp. NBH84]QNE42122.1 hypothetical protein F1C16_21100 [Hymenobacter sp. NBH84]